MVEYVTEATSTKKLGFGVLLFILINSVLGSSLFYLPGQGFSSAGPASIVAWLVLFIMASVLMLYMGELVTLHPTSGGTYEFCKRAYGRFGSFVAGWTIWIAGNFGMALNLVAAAEYFIPEQTTAAFYLRIAFALLWIIVLNFMAFRGVDAGATMLVAFGIIASLVVLLMTLPSFIDVPGLLSGQFGSPFDSSLLSPFFQHGGRGALPSLLLALFVISEAFFGFEVISYLANEAKEPKKLHKVMITGMVICGLIMGVYIFSSLGTVEAVDYAKDLRPFAVQAMNTMGLTGQNIVVFGMYLVIVGAAAAWPITGSRLLQAMARDNLFVKNFVELHPKHKSPHRAVVFQGVMVALFSWFIFRGYIVNWGDPYRSIYLVYVLLSMLVISLIVLCVPILRRKEAHLKRPFKAPFGTVVPVAFVLVLLGLVVNWIWLEKGIAWSIFGLAASFVVVGLPFYFLVEMFYDPVAIRKVSDKLVFLTRFGESGGLRKAVLEHLGDMKGLKVLEFGCATGGLTKKLVERVGPSGKVVAVDFSAKKIEYAKEKFDGMKNVKVGVTVSLDSFSMRDKVDGVVSVGVLSYLQNPEAVLKGIAVF